MHNYKWPKHKAGMSIEHNPHLNLYQTLGAYLGYAGIEDDDWVSKDDKQLALETGQLWVLRWYPNTPVGFLTAAAVSFESLLVFCDEYKD